MTEVIIHKKTDEDYFGESKFFNYQTINRSSGYEECITHWMIDSISLLPPASKHCPLAALH